MPPAAVMAVGEPRDRQLALSLWGTSEQQALRVLRRRASDHLEDVARAVIGRPRQAAPRPPAGRSGLRVASTP